MAIGKLIETLIEEKGLRVVNVAKDANIPPTTIYGTIKRDSTKIEMDILIKLLDALEITPNQFFDRYSGKQVEKPLTPETIENMHTDDTFRIVLKNYGENAAEALFLFLQLDEREQGKMLGRMETLSEEAFRKQQPKTS